MENGGENGPESRGHAPSAPSAEQLRNRLLSPRQKTFHSVRPATTTGVTSRKGTANIHPLSQHGSDLPFNPETWFGEGATMEAVGTMMQADASSRSKPSTAARNARDVPSTATMVPSPAATLQLKSRLNPTNGAIAFATGTYDRPGRTTMSGSAIQSMASDSSNSLFAVKKIRARSGIEEVVNFYSNVNTPEDAPYVHMTPRHYLESVRKESFYDLVVVGGPGLQLTSLPQQHQYPPHLENKVVQVSKRGVLLADNFNSNNSELISLKAFVKERELFEQIRRLKFFCYFKECKAFIGWHLYARKQRIRRARQSLSATHFAHTEIVRTLWLINNALYSMETEVELFWFHGNGIVSISRYLDGQISHFEAICEGVACRINQLGDIVGQQLAVVLSGDEHLDYVKAVLKGHPYSYLPSAGDGVSGGGGGAGAAVGAIEVVDWVKVRSIQRLQEDVKHKMEDILCVANFMTQAALGRMIRKFWLRVSTFIGGIERISYRSSVSGYWEIDVAAQPPSITSASSNIVNAVTKDWLDEGSHLSVDVVLALRNGSTIPSTLDFLIPQNSRQLKVDILPNKFALIERMHDLFGALGKFLECLPNLRQHPVALQHDQALIGGDPVLAPLPTDSVVVGPEVDAEHNHPKSRGYFARMQLAPLLNNQSGSVQALDVLAHLMEAYGMSLQVETYKLKIEDGFKKLCMLSPDTLVKQLNFSLVLPKIALMIQSPELVDDCHRALVRDKSRLASIQKMVSLLETSQQLSLQFDELKHGSGFVTSFHVALEQLRVLIAAQRKRLYAKLPNAFLNRVKRLFDFLAFLEEHMTLSDTGLAGLIDLLKKLKNFDSAFPMLDLEFDICCTMYNMIATATGAAESGPATSSPSLSRSPKHQYKLLVEARSRINTNITRDKSLLLGLLSQIKGDTNERKLALHGQIAKYTEMIHNPLFLDSSQSAALNTRQLVDIETAVKSLQEQVNDTANTQDVLLDAHDIVGAASVVLTPNEVDKFTDMTVLVDMLAYRKRAWQAISEIGSLSLTLLNSKLGKFNGRLLCSQVASLQLTIRELQGLAKREVANSSDKNAGKVEDLVALLQERMEQIRPRLELVSCLASKTLRVRHLQRLSDDVFSAVGLTCRFLGKHGEIVTVAESNSSGNNVPAGLGPLENIQLSALVARGLGLQLPRIRTVATEAVVERMLESVITQLEDTVRSATFATSTEWLRDSKLREKIFFELFQVINLTQSTALVQFCLKGTLMLEQLSIDMNLLFFNNRIESLRENLMRLDRFIENIREIQDKWMYVFHYVKFSPASELDRDTTKSYQTCSEVLKRIELIVQQKSGNVRLACTGLIEHENEVENCKHSLTSIMEDSHSYIQSCLDGCPRLSLLSYTRLHQLLVAWMIGPHHHRQFVSSCFHDMFEGVGTLSFMVNITLRKHCCSGFVCNDATESITFADAVDYALSLPQFVKEFEMQLRAALTAVADSLMLCRIQSMRALLAEATTPSVILANVESIFRQRVQHQILFTCDEFANQSFVILNACLWAEDVWTCLGHPTGALLLARPDLQHDSKLFAGSWQASLERLVDVCKFNLQILLDHLHGSQWLQNLKGKKARALFSSLFFQEVNFLRIAEKLMMCSCVESACELWAGSFQYKYLYKKEVRFKGCPFDTILGCVTVPYGLEYQGGSVKIGISVNQEDIVQRVVSSAFCFNATVLVNSEGDTVHPTEAVGEFSVTVKDIALALGRTCVTLSSVTNPACPRLFLARLLYLDAVGCVDFSCLDPASLQLLTTTLHEFWKALDSKNDVLFRESLKYPLQTKFGVSDAQLQRKKDNLIELRENIDFAGRHHKFPGIIVVALASETQSNANETIFNYFGKDVFDTISVPHAHPMERVGMRLSVEGYKYGMEIQEVMISTVFRLKEKHSAMKNMMACLSSSQFMGNLVLEAGKVLTMRLEHLRVANFGIERFKLELNCIAVIFWECVLVLGDESDSSNEDFHHDCVCGFEDLYLNLMQESQVKAQAYNASLHESLAVSGEEGTASKTNSEMEVSYFSIKKRHKRCMIPTSIDHQIRALAREHGLWTSPNFIEYSAALWNLLSNTSHAVVILSGPAGSGKSSLREIVVGLIEANGAYPDLPRSSIGPIRVWRAGYLIARTLVNWYRSPLFLAWRNRSKRQAADHHEPSASSHPKHKSRIAVTVIFHSSLSHEHLLGSFDAHGRWRDGLLLRKIRRVDLCDQGHNRSNRLELVVLDGPLGYFIEQVFGSFYCLSHTAHSSGAASELDNRTIVFPCSELYQVPENLRFLIETNDLEQASPAIAVYLPHFHVSQSAASSADRLIRVWVRSVKHWLENFPPWREALDDLIQMLLCTEFISELLFYHDSEVNQHKPHIVVSKTGTFLRCLETLLGQCHKLACSEAVFSKGDNDSSDSDTDEKKDGANDDDNYSLLQQDDATTRNISLLVMTLGEHGRDRLLRRVRLSFAYSAIWAFGGHCHSQKARQGFEHVFRERLYNHFEQSIPLPPSNESIFTFVLDLPGCALEIAKFSNAHSSKFELPQRLQGLRISVERLTQSQSLNNPSSVAGSSNEMLFHCPMLTAFESAVELFLGAGGFPLIFGVTTSGKSCFVRNVLLKLRQKLKSPQQIQQHILENLVDIINGRMDPGADTLNLTLLLEALSRLRKMATVPDSKTTFAQCWQTLVEPKMIEDEVGFHCQEQMVFSAGTSLAGCNSASALKSWLCREFSTEVSGCLETPRNSYGVVFLDDVHLVAARSNQDILESESNRWLMQQDRCEALLKGMVANFPAFGLRRNVRIRKSGSLFSGPLDGSMPRSSRVRPYLHKDSLTDPRLLSVTDDNFILKQLGFIACASTSNFPVFAASYEASQFISHFGLMNYPEFSTSEIHASLIMGSYVALDVGSDIASALVATLKNEIVELAGITLSVCKRMVSSADVIITSELERSVRSIVQLDINLVSRFCSGLLMGSATIANPGGLLELYAHEWRRYFLDPFPSGPQRERFGLLFQEELQAIDCRRWCISKDWFQQTIQRSFDSKVVVDRVWINPRVFESSTRQSATHLAKDDHMNYLPMELLQLSAAQAGATTFTESKNIDCSNTLFAADSFHTVLYPASMCLVLRLVRILNAGHHALVCGFHGTHKRKGIQLAAKLCERDVMSFDSKEFVGTDTPASLAAVSAVNFRKFLKSVALRCAGFRNTRSDCDESTFDMFFHSAVATFEVIEPANVVMTIFNAQELCIQDQRMLLQFLDTYCAIQIFEDHEIIGLSECLRDRARADLKAASPWTASTANDVNDFEPLLCPASKTSTRTQATGDMHNSSHYRGRHSLTGYTFHWVKRHLREMLRKNLIVVMDCTLPKATALLSSNDPNPMLVQQASISAKRSRKFSLMSQPAKAAVLPSATSAQQQRPQNDGSVLYFVSLLLSPVFRQCFSSVWWEVDEMAAANGVCTLALTSSLSTTNLEFPLHLKSVSVGEYFDQEEIAAQTANLNDVVDSHGNRKLNDKKVSKKVSCKWSTTKFMFRFLFQNIHWGSVVKYLSQYNHFGIFSSHQLTVPSFLSSHSAASLSNFVGEHDIKTKLESLSRSDELARAKALFISVAKEECCALLPHLLTTSVPCCDAIVASDSILVTGMESMAELTSQIVSALIDEAASTVLTKRFYLALTLDALQEAKVVLSTLTDKETELLESLDALDVAYRTTWSEVQRLRQQIENFRKEFRSSCVYESTLMLHEEMLSHVLESMLLENEQTEKLTQARESIMAVTNSEWHTLATTFTSKARPAHVEIIKVLMNILNFTVSDIPKKKSKSAPKTELELIARNAVMLLRSPDFANQVISIHPQSLTPPQLEAINSLRFSYSAAVIDDEDCDVILSKTVVVQSVDHPIMDALRLLMFALESSSRAMDRINSEKMTALRLNEQFSNQLTINNDLLNARIAQLEDQIDHKSSVMQMLDAEQANCRSKLSSMQALVARQMQVSRVISVHETVAAAELARLDDILSLFVTDACVTAAVLARAGWLPPELRADCAKILRQSLIKIGLKVSQSFLLTGCLVDAAQLRRWGRSDFTRFPQAVDCLALSLLTPGYTLAVDPHGIAESLLVASAPKGYNCVQIPAGKFTLGQLEQLCKQVHSEKLDGLCLIISDVQAGCSDDLLAFLSADLQLSSVPDTTGSDVFNNLDGSGDLPAEYLIAHCNPSDALLYPNSGLQAALLCRIRVYLISSCAPTHVENRSTPLPLSCLKNVTVVHWGALDAGSFIQQQSLGLLHGVGSEWASLAMCTRHLETRVSVFTEQHVSDINSQCVDLTNMLGSLLGFECVIISSWVLFQREKMLQPFNVDGLIMLDAANLSFLSDSSFVELLLSIEKQRYSSLLDRSVALSLEREQRYYEHALVEAITMSMEYVSSAKKLIPPEVLPPYALSSQAIGRLMNRAIAQGAGCNGIEMNRMFGIPTSLELTFKALKCLMRVQRKFRQLINQRAKAVATKVPPMSRGRRVESTGGNRQVLAQQLAAFQRTASFPVRENAEDASLPTADTSAIIASPESPVLDPSKPAINSEDIDKAEDINVLSVGGISKRLEFSRMFRRERKVASVALRFFLAPLREWLVNSVNDYLIRIIRPGYEWLAKFAMISVAWSKSSPASSSSPDVELRTLSRLVRSSINSGLVPRRYGIVVLPQLHSRSEVSNNKSINDTTRAKDDEAGVGMVGRRMTNFLQSAQSRSSSISSIQGGSSARSTTRMSAGNASLPSIGSATSTATVSTSPTDAIVADADEETLEDTAVATELSIRVPLEKRSTAFRMFTAQQSNFSGAPKFQPKLHILKNGSIFGIADQDGGLYLGRNHENDSHEARVQLRMPVPSSEVGELDRFHCRIEPSMTAVTSSSSWTVLNSARGDPFEVEWLLLSGVKVFGSGLEAALSLGASEHVILAISNSISQSRATASACRHRRTDQRSSSLHLRQGSVSSNRASTLVKRSPASRLTARMSALSPQSPRGLSVVSGSGGARLSAKSPSLPPGSRKGSSIQEIVQSRHNSRQSMIRTSSLSSTPGTNSGAMSSTSLATMPTASPSRALGSMIQGLSHNPVARLSVRLSSKSNTESAAAAAIAATHKAPYHASNTSNLAQSSLLKLFSTGEDGLSLLHLLEAHSATTHIFGGMIDAMEDKIDELMAWRTMLLGLSLESQSFTEKEAADLLPHLIPPSLNEEECADEDSGLWAQGFELTVLQSLILAEVLVPNSAGALANAWFACLQTYLMQGGRVMQHRDEDWIEDDMEADNTNMGTKSNDGNDGEDDQDNEGDDEDGDNSPDAFDMHSSLVARGVGGGGRKGTNTSAISAGSGNNTNSSQVFEQADVALTNSWTRLKRAITGQLSTEVVITSSHRTSKYLYTLRDYENWENVLSTCFKKVVTIENYTYMSSLRSLLLGEGGIFLSGSQFQLATLSQRARNLATHNGTVIGVISCGLQNHRQKLEIYHHESSATRSNIVECLKSVRAAIGTTRFHKAVLERLDLSTTLASSVLDLGLVLSGKAATNHLNAQDTASYHVHGLHGHSKTFPLIISTDWSGTRSGGYGPLSACSGLNFVWLPRFMCADITQQQQQQQHARNGPQKTVSQHELSPSQYPPGLLESAGVLYEELESCLLWVMISCRAMTRANISLGMLHQLRHAKKVQVRLTSCLLAIWRLLLYQRSADKERAGRPANWSECVVPLSLWQLARLIIKSSEILDIDWEIDAKLPLEEATRRLQSSRRFLRAIGLLAESFGFLEHVAAEKLLAKSTAPAPPQASNPSAPVVSSKKVPVKPNVQPPSGGGASSSRSGRQSIVGAQSKDANSPTPSVAGVGIVSTALLRMKKKAAIAATQSVNKKLETLRSVNRFSILVPQQHQDITSSLAARKEQRLQAQDAKAKKRESDASVLIRLKSCLAMVIAAVVVKINANKKTVKPSALGMSSSKSRTSDASPFDVIGDLGASGGGARKDKEFQGRTSMKLDIQNMMGSAAMRSPSEGGGHGRHHHLHHHLSNKEHDQEQDHEDEDQDEEATSELVFEARVGALEGADLVNSLLLWTLDSSDKSNQLNSAERKMKISKQVLAAMIAHKNK